MKLNAEKNYKYTGDVFAYVVVTSADGTVSEKRYDTVGIPAPMDISVNLLGELVIKSDAKFQLDAYIGNIVDRNGEEIYTDGLWQIFQTAPLLNQLALKDGYQYRARLISGQI